ncbi:MAG: zinc ABC transporter substrate-binding protein [Aquiluna sp.]|nr:zinc ABC transporter substrate-binding protein [Aquiluna sp.]
MKLRWFFIGIASAAAVALVLFATSLFNPETPEEEAPTSTPSVTREGSTGVIKVATSTNVWASVIELIGGEWVEVSAIITDPLQDPHSYEASARDQLAISDAELVVANGGGYDEFMEVLLAATEGEKLFLELVEGDHSHTEDKEAHSDEEEHAGDEHADEHDHGNEHIWYDLELVAEAAEHIAEAITELRPEAFDSVTANYDFFISELANLELRVEALRERSLGTAVIALEGVGNLMLEHAGFEDVTPEALADAIEEEREVPAVALDQAQSLLEGKVAGLLVVNAQMLDQVSERLIQTAEANQIPVITLSELIPDPELDYLDWMALVLDQLQEAVY